MTLKSLRGNRLRVRVSGRHTCAPLGGLRNSGHFPAVQDLTDRNADGTLRAAIAPRIPDRTLRLRSKSVATSGPVVGARPQAVRLWRLDCFRPNRGPARLAERVGHNVARSLRERGPRPTMLVRQRESERS